MIHIFDKNYYRYFGRILVKDDIVYLGFTNSKVEFYIKGDSEKETVITAKIGSKANREEDFARLRVYVDDELYTKEPIVLLDKELETYPIAVIKDGNEHKISIIKITEAQMSYAAFHDIIIENGTLMPLPKETDNRTKVEFIGDSITCGYGVHGEPMAEYHIKDEDGEITYAALAAKELNLNARYTAVSGYGVYCEYTGDTKGTLPRVYPYINWWADQNELYDFQDFTPELVVINLGTNDSRFFEESEEAQEGFTEKFITAYIDYLKFIRSKYPKAKLLCICGTLATQPFSRIEKACEMMRKSGAEDIYTLELPYHDVEHDSQASQHPSAITHQKDAKRLIAKIKEIMPELA